MTIKRYIVSLEETFSLLRSALFGITSNGNSLSDYGTNIVASEILNSLITALFDRDYKYPEVISSTASIIQSYDVFNGDVNTLCEVAIASILNTLSRNIPGFEYTQALSNYRMLNQIDIEITLDTENVIYRDQL